MPLSLMASFTMEIKLKLLCNLLYPLVNFPEDFPTLVTTVTLFLAPDLQLTL